MKKESRKLKKKSKRKRQFGCIGFVCWVLVPLFVIILLTLDGLGLYPFNTQRLLVLGACLLIMLLPFFKEISINNISIKKDDAAK